MLHISFAVLVICLLCITVPRINAESATAETKNGVLKGKFMTSRDGNTYEAFIGIRYGVVPRRFQKSEPSPPWEGSKDATEFGPMCAQNLLVFNPPPDAKPELIGEEDCLFINVYTPNSDNKKRPVLVFIHGGGFFFGSSDIFGAEYFMDEDIVLVTFNYRLGILGFLSTGDEHAPGNMGLKDQVLGLKWVQENVEAFGGDPTKVTISGESAGAGSVMHLLLSPTAKGLYRSAIGQSGTAFSSWAYTESTLERGIVAGKHLKCDTDNTKELVACMRKKPLAELVATQLYFGEYYFDPIVVFPPTQEIQNEHNPEPYVVDSPKNLVKTGRFNKVPLLLTVNKEEGSMFHAAAVLRTPQLLKPLNEEWERIAPITFYFRDNPYLQGRNNAEIAQKIRKFYFNDQEISMKTEQNLTNLYTDAWFLHGIHEAALEISKHNVPVYTAVVTHERKDFNILSVVAGTTERLGTTHVEEIPYLFGRGNPGTKYSDIFTQYSIKEPRDVEFSKGFVKMFSSFVKTGIPEVTLGDSPKFNPVSKQEAETGQLNWLKLDLQPKLLINPFHERMAFWDSIFKNNRDEL